MEMLLMSRKERGRLTVLAKVKSGELALCRAAEAMSVSYRQAKRIWKRYIRGGDAALVHRSRGKEGSRRIADGKREKILKVFEKEYRDFGPTLAAEYLEQKGLEIDHETLRRWLISRQLWTVKRRRQKHRQWRERRACFGEMVQIDGSHHDWFEGRRERAVLMVMVDDATGRILAGFSEEETTEACYDIFERWARQWGMPLSLYADRDSIYRCERKPTIAEQISGNEPQTQFGRAMERLGVEIIPAYSPQAKGRVERCNGTLQDRLVKALRLAGITDLKRANEFLEREFLPQFNRRFGVQAASAADLHRRPPGNLAEILCWESTRVVRKDWTVSWNNRWFQIDREHEGLSLAGREITICQLRSGELRLLWKDRKLRWKELTRRPEPAAEPPRRIGRTRLIVPEPEHPWRRFGAASGKKFWNEIKTEGQRARAARAERPVGALE
jgi:hypothetical protein